MPPEMPRLTREKVRRALDPRPDSHPILRFIKDNRGLIKDLNSRFPHAEARPIQEEYISQAYAFLAIALVGIGKFKLDPEDIIGIGARTMNILPTTPQRYAFDRIVIASFAVQDPLKVDTWKDVPLALHVGNQIPEETSRDKRGLSVVTKRLERVNASLEIISEYPGGSDPDTKVGQINENFRTGATALGLLLHLAA